MVADGEVKNGRPLKYKTVEELQTAIDNYFDSCFTPILDKDGFVVLKDNGKPYLHQTEPFTMSGLAYDLNISRQTLLNYCDINDNFLDTISRARQKVEMYAEKMLYNRDGVNGAKFNLINNFKDWSDKSAVDVNGNMQTTYAIKPAVRPVIDISDEQLEIPENTD